MWKRCTDEDYPERDVYFIAIKLSDEWFYFTNNNCPYGWNVLCRSESYWMYPPEID